MKHKGAHYKPGETKAPFDPGDWVFIPDPEYTTPTARIWVCEQMLAPGLRMDRDKAEHHGGGTWIPILKV